MVKVDQYYQHQEHEYLDATQKEVHDRIRSLLVNLERHEDLGDTVKTNVQSILEGEEKTLFFLTNTLTVAQYILSRQRYGRCVYNRYDSDDLTSRIAEEIRIQRQVKSYHQ